MSDPRRAPDDAWREAADSGTRLREGVQAGPTVTLEVSLAPALHAELLAWALACRPNEACGLMAGTRPAHAGGQATRFLPLRNAAESPYRYLIDPQEQLSAMLDLEDRDEVVWGIFHSHVASPAEPSVTDLGLAFYPDSLYLICSLVGEVPHVRAWTLAGRLVTEVPFRVGA